MYKAYYQKNIDTKSDIHFALLLIRLTPLGPGLPGLAILLFNHPIRGILPISRLPFNSNNGDEHYEALVKRQTKNDKNCDSFRNDSSFLLSSSVVVQ